MSLQLHNMLFVQKPMALITLNIDQENLWTVCRVHSHVQYLDQNWL